MGRDWLECCKRSHRSNSSFLGSTLYPSGYECGGIISYLFASYLLKQFLRRHQTHEAKWERLESLLS